MARENIAKFMEKFAADDALKAKLEGKSADEIISIAREMGFEFDKQDLIAFRDQVMELDSDHLEKASGGDFGDDIVRGADLLNEKVDMTYLLVKDLFRNLFG